MSNNTVRLKNGSTTIINSVNIGLEKIISVNVHWLKIIILCCVSSEQ